MTQMLFSDFGNIVDSCPRNKTEFTRSAARLSCGVDENGRRQYVCLPNHEKSALVEFCYGSTIGLYEKGNCIEVYESGSLDQISCLDFTDGCPSDHFFLSDLYKFPACHGINTQKRCFYADPVCPNTTTLPDTDKHLENGTLSTGVVAGITIGIIGIIVAVVVMIIILVKRRQKSRKDAQKSEEDYVESHALMSVNYQPGDYSYQRYGLGDYNVWKTPISDQFSTLTDDEVSVLFCFLCSDSGPPDFTDTEWLDMLNDIRQKMFHRYDPVTSEEAQQTLDRLKSRDFLWEDQDRIKDDAKDETMYKIASTDSRIPFCYSSYDTASVYLRSERYNRKPGEKCVISGYSVYDSLLIPRLQMNILTHVTMEDIYDGIYYTLNIPVEILKDSKDKREKFLMDLRKGGEAVYYRGRSQDSVQHVTWLWRYGLYNRPDVVRSCIGLHPHNDIYIIDNKAYRKPNEYHKYPEEDRSLLYCLLLCEKYTCNVNEETDKSILKKIREKYFPKLAPSADADFTRLQHYVKETQTWVVTFASENIKHDVMYAFVTECLVEDRDLEFFLTTASRDVMTEYCRSWEYKRSEGERCLYVPDTPKKMMNLFIDKLQLDIITHCTVSDRGIHNSISKRWKIPEEILSWDQEARERYLGYAKRGTQTVHHSRGMIVGCADAGKTTLLKRLLRCSEEEILNVKSTEGLEVHEEVFEICESTRTLKVKKINSEAVHDRSSQKTVSFFDFGGQCAYYACHQIYLTRRAFYMVVVDASKRLDQVVEKEVCDQMDTVFAKWKYKDYFQFWMKSIHTYCYGNSHGGRDSDVVIILVATHWDKSVYKDKVAFLDGLQRVLPANSNLVQYIREDRCFCTEFPISPINDIEEFIVQIAAEEKWSEQIPHEWVFFDDKIQKEKHKRVLNLVGIIDVLSHHGHGEQIFDMAEDMLRYHHDAGKILHFNEEHLNTSAIIDVQWFVNAFKVVITDRHHVKGIVAKRQDWEEYYETGNLPDSLLSDIWKLEDKKLLQTIKTNSSSETTNIDEDSRFLLNHKEELLLYMQRLGLISSEGQTHYVPSMNKKDFGETQKERIMGADSKSSILVFLFDFLPYFFFYRLVVRLMQINTWEILTDDGISCLYKDAALFCHKDNNIAVAVTSSTIQLQIFQLSSDTIMLPEATLSIRRTIEEILHNMTKTFHKDVKYRVGFICDGGENQILGKEVTHNFVEENELKAKGEMTCPRHKMETHHTINPKYMCAYWK